jgi:O-antigen/teichoic acid export membrane protein
MPYKAFDERQARYLHLFTGYGISFVFIALSYVVYSRILSPAEFGLYSVALAIGSFGTFLLDGGLRTTIIIHEADFSRSESGTLLSGLAAGSIALSAALVLLEKPMLLLFPPARADYRFLCGFAVVYLVSYPFVAVPTALLERRLRYSRIAWIETVGVVAERASPALFLSAGGFGMESFVIGAALGRGGRVLLLALAHPVRPAWPSWNRLQGLVPVVRKGLGIQAGSAGALVRDNLHVLLVVPLFGKAWAGYYTWGYQLGLVLSQAFVQVSSRISLPLLAQASSFEERWRICRDQARWMMIFTGPLLVAGLAVISPIDRHLLGGKWAPAIGLLPFLFLRMVGGSAMTPVGNLLPIQSGSKAFARAALRWTALEAVAAAVLLATAGPAGLAYSGAIGVWVGIFLFLRVLDRDPWTRLGGILREVWIRPSLAFAAACSAGVYFVFVKGELRWTASLAAAALTIAASYCMEPEIRRFLRERSSGWRARR